MDNDGKTSGSPTRPPAGRKERLAAQLRANLKRRKEQARERQAEAEPAKPVEK